MLLKITQVHTRYVVEWPENKLHVLNEKGLKWNLKHVFGIRQDGVSVTMQFLSANGYASVDVERWQEQAA